MGMKYTLSHVYQVFADGQIHKARSDGVIHGKGIPGVLKNLAFARQVMW